jgi:hypothetical protein
VFLVKPLGRTVEKFAIQDWACIGFGARAKAIEVNRPYLTNLTTLACTATARLAIMWYAFSDV